MHDLRGITGATELDLKFELTAKHLTASYGVVSLHYTKAVLLATEIGRNDDIVNSIATALQRRSRLDVTVNLLPDYPGVLASIYRTDVSVLHVHTTRLAARSRGLHKINHRGDVKLRRHRSDRLVP